MPDPRFIHGYDRDYEAQIGNDDDFDRDFRPLTPRDRCVAMSNRFLLSQTYLKVSESFL